MSNLAKFGICAVTRLFVDSEDIGLILSWLESLNSQTIHLRNVLLHQRDVVTTRPVCHFSYSDDRFSFLLTFMSYVS